MAPSTKRMLAESLKKLLRKRTLDKVTVKDIVEDCGVNRQTFYYHFHDVYDLMDWIFQDEIDGLMAQDIDYDDWTAGLGLLFQFMRENRLVILNAYNSISHEAVADYTKKFLRPFARRVVCRETEGMDPPPDPEDVEFVADIITLTAAGFVLEWAGKQLQDRYLTRSVEKVKIAIDGSIQAMLRNLAEAKNPGRGLSNRFAANE